MTDGLCRNALDGSELQRLRAEQPDILRSSITGNTSDHATPSSYSIADLSSQIVKLGISTASTYRSMAKRSTGIEKPTWMRWAQDAKDLRGLNIHAYNLATKVVEQEIIAAPTGKMPPLQMSRRAGELEKLAWEMLEETMPREDEATWGSVANEQLKALIALGKVLGPDGEGQVRG